MNQANSESSKMFVHNVSRTERAKCACTRPYEAPVSESRFEPRLQHCRKRCRFHGFIEKDSFRESDVIPAHIITRNGLCSSSCVKWGFSFDQNTKFMSHALRQVVHSPPKRILERHTVRHNANPRRHPTVQS